MGRTGHLIKGHFDPQWPIPVACAGVIGDVIGGKLDIKTKPQKLKMISTFSTSAAAVVMIVNASLSR